MQADKIGPDWPCEAYGAGGLEVGARCFVADLGDRLCLSRAECGEIVAESRARLFARINELAAQGDPTGIFLAREFPTPQEIFKGDSA